MRRPKGKLNRRRASSSNSHKKYNRVEGSTLGPTFLPLSKLRTHTARTADLVTIARGAGIKNAKLVRELSEFPEVINDAFQAEGASFITIKVEWGEPFPASTLDGPENKYRFIRYIEKTENLKLMQ